MKRAVSALELLLCCTVFAAMLSGCSQNRENGTGTVPPSVSREPAPLSPAPTPSPEPTPVYSSFAPGEMSDLVRATYEIDGKGYTVDDADARDRLEMKLGGAGLREDPVSGKLWDGAEMTLERADGSLFKLSVCEDGRCLFSADEAVYAYEAKWNTELLSLFYVDAIHDRFRQEPESAMEYITLIDWRRYAARYGEEETLALIDAFGEWALNGDGPEHYRELFDSTYGIENSYLEAYAYYVTEAYELHKPEFCDLAVNGVSRDSYQRIEDMLSCYWGYPTYHIWERVNQVLLYGY